MSEIDPWSGRDDFSPESDIEIKSAEFAYDSVFGDNPIVKLYVNRFNEAGLKVVDADTGNAMKFGVGGGWEVTDGGKGLKATESNSKGLFSKQSSYYKFFESVLRVMPEFRQKGTPAEAGIWSDVKLHTTRTVIGVNSQTGKDRQVELATGVFGGSTGVETTQNDPLEAAMKEKLESVAAEVKNNGGTHDQFLTQVMSIVESDKAARDAAFDDADGSIWANA